MKLYISVQIGDPEIVNYFQVIESCSSCLDKFERGFTNSFIFEKSTSNYYRDLSNPIRVILTKPFYYCHSTRVVESSADSFKKKKKKIIPSFQDSSIESMRGITRCNYTPAKGFNACSIRRNARVQLQPYSPDARPNINSARNK